MLTGNGRNLVGDRQHGVEALLAGDVEIVLQLPSLEHVSAGLDFH